MELKSCSDTDSEQNASPPPPSTFNDWLIVVYTRHLIIRPEDANNSDNLQILRKGLCRQSVRGFFFFLLNRCSVLLK